MTDRTAHILSFFDYYVSLKKKKKKNSQQTTTTNQPTTIKRPLSWGREITNFLKEGVH